MHCKEPVRAVASAAEAATAAAAPDRHHAMASSAALLLLVMAAAAAAACAGGARLIDITVPVAAGLPVFQQAAGLPRIWRSRWQEISEGDECNQSHLSLDAHTGTHIDAPVHFLDGGSGVEALDLAVLMGPALVVEVQGSNVTAEALRQLRLPPGVTRLLFKTDNTDKELMYRRAFEPSYIGITPDGAEFITQHTQLQLVGIDYLSIGALEGVADTHRTLFKKGVIAVEGLDLRQVAPGWWHMICLPAKLAGSDGAPVRCVLEGPLPGDGGEVAHGEL